MLYTSMMIVLKMSYLTNQECVEFLLSLQVGSTVFRT